MALHSIEQPLPISLQFDASILRSLEKKVTAKSSFKGQLDTYRYCDNASCGRGHEKARGVCACRVARGRRACRCGNVYGSTAYSSVPHTGAPTAAFSPSQVWDFVIKNVTFRLSPTQSSSKKDDLEVSADRVRLVLVDSKVVTAANPQQG